MKHTFLLISICVLLCLALCEHQVSKKKKHKEHLLRKFKFGPNIKNGFKKTKRVSSTIEIDMKDRKIRGSVNETKTIGTKYYQFQGVAYAKPPVGELRFEPPQRYDWNGTYDATYQRNICAQTNFVSGLGVQGTEDCLYLNIYSPSLSSSLPVLVFIHGGFFLFDDGNYESYPTDRFIDQNLVIVTLNYRLGVFGFFATGDSVVPGNMGLKDQVLALQWIQENIQYFGGNPKNVTIMGQSAGAGSVSYLVQSPVTKGLFQKAILQSGNSLVPLALSRTAAANARLLAGANFIPNRNTTEIVQGLKKIDYRSLATTSFISMSIILLGDFLNGLVYAPVIEPPNPTQFYSTKSYEQLATCNLTSVPILIGYNSEEVQDFSNNSMLGIVQFYLLRYDLNPNDLVPLDMNVADTDRSKVGNQIKETYVGESQLLASSKGVSKFLTDDFFIRPTIEFVKLYSKCAFTYLYRFSYTGNSTGGARHGDEMYYLFDNNNLVGERNQTLSKDMVKIWSNFIKTGNTTPDETEFNMTWYPSSAANNYSYLDIGEQFAVHDQETNPDKFYLDKWTYWYSTYGHRPFDTY